MDTHHYREGYTMTDLALRAYWLDRDDTDDRDTEPTRWFVADCRNEWDTPQDLAEYGTHDVMGPDGSVLFSTPFYTVGLLGPVETPWPADPNPVGLPAGALRLYDPSNLPTDTSRPTPCGSCGSVDPARLAGPFYWLDDHNGDAVCGACVALHGLQSKPEGMAEYYNVWSGG